MTINDNREDHLFDVIVTSLDSGELEDRREAIWARWELLAATLFNSQTADNIRYSVDAARKMYAQSKLSASEQWTSALLGRADVSIDLAERIQSALMYVYAHGDENSAMSALTALCIVFSGAPERKYLTQEDIHLQEHPTREDIHVQEYPFSVQEIVPVHIDDGYVSAAEEQQVRDWFTGLIERMLAESKHNDGDYGDKRNSIVIGPRAYQINMIRTVNPVLPRATLLDFLRLPQLDEVTLNAIQSTLFYWAEKDEKTVANMAEALVVFLYLHPNWNGLLPDLDWQIPANRYRFERVARLF